MSETGGRRMGKQRDPLVHVHNSPDLFERVRGTNKGGRTLCGVRRLMPWLTNRPDQATCVPCVALRNFALVDHATGLGAILRTAEQYHGQHDSVRAAVAACVSAAVLWANRERRLVEDATWLMEEDV